MTKICPVCSSIVDEKDSCCPRCAFKLMGSTQSFKPINYEGDELLGTSSEPGIAGTLRVLRGPQIQMQFSLSDDEASIGRSPQCRVFLNDMTVSRLHATITVRNNTFYIRDENSFNGTWLNNLSVTEAALKSGDIIQIGSFVLLFEQSKHTSA